MNNISNIIAVIAAIALAYFAFTHQQAPQPAAQGKLDLGVVCEGALAYMTFPDAAAAEIFVAECKEGKHPDVVEQYTKSLNLDGAQI